MGFASHVVTLLKSCVRITRLLLPNSSLILCACGQVLETNVSIGYGFIPSPFSVVSFAFSQMPSAFFFSKCIFPGLKIGTLNAFVGIVGPGIRGVHWLADSIPIVLIIKASSFSLEEASLVL